MMYTLEDLALKWKITENDILRMAINKKIVLSAWWQGAVNIREDLGDEEGDSFFKWTEFFNGLFTIDGYYLKVLLANLPVEIISFYREDDQLHFAKYSSDEFSNEGPPAYFNLTRDKIVMTTEQFETADAKYFQLSATVSRKVKAVLGGDGMPDRKSTPPETADKDRITSTKPFTQAIEKMYRHYHEKKEYSFLVPDYVDAFIQQMSGLLKKEESPHIQNEMELINYLAKRIRKVKKVTGEWKIITEEFEKNSTGNNKTTLSSITYDVEHVSKKLCLLRKDYPIPCTIPIP
jgi:hypothetical protein